MSLAYLGPESIRVSSDLHPILASALALGAQCDPDLLPGTYTLDAAVSVRGELTVLPDGSLAGSVDVTTIPSLVLAMIR